MENTDLQSNQWERIARLERRVDYLLRYLQIDPANVDAGAPLGPGTANLPGGLEIAPQNEAADAALIPVYEAIRRGKPINAIKIYRELTGCSLPEAKFAVDSMTRNL